MKIEKINRPIKCDFYGCTRMAKYGFSTKGFLRRELVFCEDCMKEMFECFSKEMVPRAIDPPYKTEKRRKKLN